MLSSRLPVFILVMMSLWCQATADKYYKSGWKAVSTSDKIGKKRPSYSMARSTSANDVGKNEGNDMTQRLVNTSEIIANITGQVGSTVFLPCTTHHALERQVSWVRRRDWHILTSGGLTYTQEGRFNVHHPEGTTEWTLAIKYVRLRDTGIYECQIAAGEGLMSQSVFLNVVVPQAVIPGQGEYHVDTGSTITLDCYIQQVE
ncbi:hypothetical protein SK128_009942 [Halocaridina rubra]|uniref:Ig-like domain-containing protein n=1 Tax=Halocaridina rubra TaxID=373956 RepID=A0AAN9AGD5_HALRR